MFTVQAIRAYKAHRKGELSFKKQQQITVTQTNEQNYMYYGKYDNKEGWFPYFYVKPMNVSQFNEKSEAELKQQEASARRGTILSFVSDKIKSPSVDENTQKKQQSEQQYVLKSGMLRKKDLKSKNKVDNFWFVLRSVAVTYYRSAVDQKPLGKFLIKDIKAVNMGESTDCFWFNVDTNPKGKKFILGAQTEMERQDWVEMIMFAQTGAKPVTAAEKVLNRENQQAAQQLRIKKRRSVNVLKLGKLATSMDLKRLLARRIGEDDMDDTFINEDEVINENDTIDKKKIGIARVRAKKGYQSTTEYELNFRQYDEWVLLDKTEELGWWLGIFEGRVGYFPSIYVEIIENLQNGLSDSQIPSQNTNNNVQLTTEGQEGTMVGNFVLEERIKPTPEFTGTVYRARHKDNGTCVFISQYLIDQFTSGEINTITNHITKLKILNHPQILLHKGIIKTKTHLNILSEYFEGEPLSNLITCRSDISHEQLVAYVKQILLILVYLHSNSIVHYGIRADNIIITDANQLKLSPVEFTCLLGDFRPIQYCNWAAPETVQQVNIKNNTGSADIWGLGCSIIELLEGRPPYDGLSKLNINFSIIERDLPELPEDISPLLTSFLKKCLIRDAPCRFTAKELLAHPIFHVNNVPKEVASAPLPAIDTSLENANPLEDSGLNYTVDPVMEMLHWFTTAMDKGNISHSVKIRKRVRDKLKELKQKPDSGEISNLLKDALRRCEKEFGEHIPIDSDDDDDIISDSYSDEFEDEDDPFL